MDDRTRTRLAATFDGAAELYERVRPGFAPAALDWVLPDRARRVLDLGAGTGKLTEALVARGLEVVAVDPSPNMLAQLRFKLPGVDARVATSEATGLADGEVDAIVVGSAFHWFARPDAEREMARILRPGGVVGLLWNQRDPSSSTVRAFHQAQAHATETRPGEHTTSNSTGAGSARPGTESSRTRRRCARSSWSSWSRRGPTSSPWPSPSGPGCWTACDDSRAPAPIWSGGRPSTCPT